MRTEQLEYLIEISKTHSISEASERLHLTRSALSLSIKSLENELGIQLLERAHRGSWLTEEGNKIVDGAQTFFNLIHSLQKTQQQETTSNFSGELSFYSCLWVSELVMPQIIVNLKKNYPAIQLNPTIIRSESAFQTMLDAPKEFALTQKTFYNKKWGEQNSSIDTSSNTSLTFYPFFTSYLYCQLHTNLPDALQESISMKKLLSYPILLLQEQQNNTFFSELLCKFNPNVQIIPCNNKAIYDEMLLSGLGVGVNYFPNSIIATKSTAPSLKAIPISEKDSCQFGYLAYKNRQLSPLSKFFLRYFCDFMKLSYHVNKTF